MWRTWWATFTSTTLALSVSRWNRSKRALSGRGGESAPSTTRTTQRRCPKATSPSNQPNQNEQTNICSIQSTVKQSTRVLKTADCKQSQVSTIQSVKRTKNVRNENWKFLHFHVFEETLRRTKVCFLSSGDKPHSHYWYGSMKCTTKTIFCVKTLQQVSFCTYANTFVNVYLSITQKWCTYAMNQWPFLKQ